jgi:hypothetical protein
MTFSCACAILVVSMVSSAPKTTVVKETYRGWAHSYRISNGVADLVVVPQIGRVMRYGLKGKPNVLWENAALDGTKPIPKTDEWLNYGGDKLWPAPQDLWGWPPDTDLDGSAHRAEVIANGLRITSPISKKFSIEFQRDILLDAATSTVTFENRMTNKGSTVQKLSIWQITQLDDPSLAVLTLHRTDKLPKGFFDYGTADLLEGYHTVVGEALHIRRHPKTARKFGAGHPGGLITAVVGKFFFEMSAPISSDLVYPDSGSHQQIYTNPDPLKYVEMEIAGPVVEIKPGETISFPVTWNLTTTP